MMQLVLDAVVSTLKNQGLPVVAEFLQIALDKKTPAVCVGIRSESLETPGFGNYLGKEERDGVPVELYGVKASVAVLLDLYIPAGHMEECQSLFTALSKALAALPGGLRINRLTRGEAAPDAGVGMFRCPCTLEGTAYFCGAMEEGTGVWVDFVLRGVMNNERE